MGDRRGVYDPIRPRLMRQIQWREMLAQRASGPKTDREPGDDQPF
jgi:hypothetical protein